MKKKIIISVLMLIIVMTLAINVFAVNYNNSYYDVYIPNKFEVLSEKENEDNIQHKITYIGDDYMSSIMLCVWKRPNALTYTQSEVDDAIQNIKNIYGAVNSVTGSIVEINGVHGYRIHVVGDGYEHDICEFVSDNYRYSIQIESYKSYLDSSEFDKIINSFMIKDSVKKTRGIPFTDIASNAWYYNAAKYAYTNNIISGYNAYTFGPEDNLTRGQLVTILWRMEGSPKVTGTPKFPDVQDSSQYYFKAVKWATDNKIVSGYNNGKFGPEDNITREQLAVMLNKYAKYNNKNTSVSKDLSSFKDAKKVSDYAVSQMKWAVGAGVITGNADGTLNPLGTATRAEVAAMLEKYCKKVGR